MVNKICKQCGKEFCFDETDKTNIIRDQNIKGYCQRECFSIYRKSEEYRRMYMQTYLKNKNISFDENIEFEHLKNIFHQIRSSEIKKSQPKRVDTIRKRYGADAFSKICSLGNFNKKSKFLLEYKLCTTEELCNLTEEQITKIYNKNFSKLTNHAHKIHLGHLKKYGSEENIKEAYKQVLKQRIIIDLNLPVNISDSNYEQKRREYFQNVINFNNNDPKRLLKYKKTHIKNHWNINSLSDGEIDNLPNDVINLMYGEYMSDRMKTLSEVTTNGYKKTKKGFFTFKNGTKIFYRSSWELEFFTKINKFNFFSNFRVPKSYKYTKETGYQGRYFPDIQFDWNNKTFIIEIKPRCFVKENFIKWSEIIEDPSIAFRVITEYDIFIEDEKQFIKNLKKQLKKKVDINEY